MMDLEGNLLLSAYARMKRSIDNREGSVIGYDSHEYVKSVENYEHNDYNFGRDFSYENYSDIESELHKVSHIAPFAFGMKNIAMYTVGHHYPLYVGDSEEHSEFIGEIYELDVSKLLEFCNQSPFGDLLNQETKIDLNVREAKEVTSERIFIKQSDYHRKNESIVRQGKTRHHSAEAIDCISTIEEKIRDHFLGSDANYDIQLVFHKLNVYSENGHFKPHTDTPTHDPALFIGTVVVCLPFEQTGGDLIVRHHNETIRFNFADKSADKDHLQFAAFYGDCEHEVLPVTSGHRVVLTYSILRIPDHFYRPHHRPASWFTVESNAATFARDGMISGPLKQADAALDKAYAAIEKYMNRPVFGLFLGHSYTESGVTAEGLKGADKLFYDFFRSKNIPISLTPVVTDLDYFDLKANMLYNGGVEDLEISKFKVQLIKDLPDLRLEEHKALSADIPFLTPWGKAGLTLKHETECVQGYAGNEVEVESVQRMYLQCAMIVGPFPGIPPEGRETSVNIYPGDDSERYG